MDATPKPTPPGEPTTSPPTFTPNDPPRPPRAPHVVGTVFGDPAPTPDQAKALAAVLRNKRLSLTLALVGIGFLIGAAIVARRAS